MKKNYIKMNEIDNYLSLGNVFRIMKEESKNKTAALQSELFTTLFGMDTVSETTINNYCVGIRRIGDDYKQIFLNYQKKYEKDKSILVPVLSEIASILEGKIISNPEISFLNQLESLKKVGTRLYNISKNDPFVSSKFIKKLNTYIKEQKYYELLVEILFYAILYHKQPITKEDIEKEKIEEILQDSCMSYKGLTEYLLVTFKENVNHNYKLKKLALEGNIYACYELGTQEYLGLIAGYPRYIEAYSYLKKASDASHPGATYTIGNMFLKGWIGDKDTTLEQAYKYFTEAKEKGSIAAINSLGLMYLDGLYVKKDPKKAEELFLKAALQDCAYAYNNLGRIKEKEKKFQEAYHYFLKSADLKESWACNKVGEYLRCGKVGQKDKKSAYFYYNQALESDYKHICYYAYYNLAKYYYSNGEIESNTQKDIIKCELYLKQAFENGIIEAGIELFFYYIKEYNKKKKLVLLEKIKECKTKLENHDKMNVQWKKEIEEKYKTIKEKIEITLVEKNVY